MQDVPHVSHPSRLLIIIIRSHTIPRENGKYNLWPEAADTLNSVFHSSHSSGQLIQLGVLNARLPLLEKIPFSANKSGLSGGSAALN